MLFRGYKPDWLYEALPYIYIAAGALTAGLLRNAGGTISGLLLILAGVIIWKLRRDYRARNRIPLAPPPDILDVSCNDEEMKLVKMVWQPSFEMGNELIDRQHRRLFALGNDLIDALMAKKPKADIELLMDELLAEITRHFESESEIMAIHQLPLSEAHQVTHRTLLSRITEMRDRFHQGKLPLGELVGFVAYDIVAQHIAKEDLQLLPAAQND